MHENECVIGWQMLHVNVFVRVCFSDRYSADVMSYIFDSHNLIREYFVLCARLGFFSPFSLTLIYLLIAISSAYIYFIYWSMVPHYDSGEWSPICCAQRRRAIILLTQISTSQITQIARINDE